jgi:Tol biopolymer transport system component
MRATKPSHVSSLLRRVAPPRGFLWVFVAGLWALITIYQVDWKAPGATPDVSPGGLHAYAARTTKRSATTRVKIKLHGSTPTMAWSPNGKKLAFNAAFEYFDFDDEYQKHKNALGVFVYNVARGKKRRVTAEQGYHPLWLSNTRLAWGNSGYEYGSPGMYLARLKRRSKPKILRLSAYRSVYHTLAGKKGGIVFFHQKRSGRTFQRTWARYDPKNSTYHKLNVKNNSWQPPSAHVKNQCRQKAGNAAVAVNKRGQITLTVGGRKRKIRQRAYRFFNYGEQTCYANSRCGPVQPCLSPKGKYLAYFSAKVKKDTYHLHIVKVKCLAAH